MGKTTITFSIDIEASGPIPGPWWMCSLGVCRTDDVMTGWSAELRPLVIPGVSKPDDAGAMEVVAKGVKGLAWDPAQSASANTARVRAHFEQHGREPTLVLRE